MLGPERHLHPVRAGNGVARVVGGAFGHCSDGEVDVLGVACTQLALVVVAPRVRVAVHVDGRAVEGAGRRGDEGELLVGDVDVLGRRERGARHVVVALAVCTIKSRAESVQVHR